MLPIIFNSSYVTLYSYPIFLGLALGIVYYVSFYLFYFYKKDELLFHKIFWPSLMCAWVGAKLFFLLTVKAMLPPETLMHLSSFWLGGGFVFYGGLLFVLIYMLMGVKLRLFSLEDVVLFIPGITLGHAVGRIGCFLAGCCYGKHSDLIDHVYMHGDYRYPVQLYESIALFMLGIYLFRLAKKRMQITTILSSYIFSYSIMRFFLEFLRGDKIRGIWLGISTSQIISLILAIFVAILWGKSHFRNLK